ncbi:MAG: YceI family protein [Bacteroidota bacterium]
MKKILILFCALAVTGASAQSKFFTKKGKITFDATTPDSPEQIRAKNENVVSVIDLSSGAMEFMLSMTAFSFEKALMQEHFNENYVESEKFPKANFKGSIVNLKDVSLLKDANYPVNIKGNMTIHGVTKEVTATGTLTVKGGTLTAGKSEFKLHLPDYGIDIPNLVSDKLSKDAKIKVDLVYEPVK